MPESENLNNYKQNRTKDIKERCFNCITQKRAPIEQGKCHNLSLLPALQNVHQYVTT